MARRGKEGSHTFGVKQKATLFPTVGILFLHQTDIPLLPNPERSSGLFDAKFRSPNVDLKPG